MKIDWTRLASFQGVVTILALASYALAVCLQGGQFDAIVWPLVFFNLAFITIMIAEGIKQVSPITVGMVVFSIGVTVMGLLFKVSHWPGANMMVLMGSSLILISYAIRFNAKKEKGIMDRLKLIWVALFSLAIPFNMLHWPNREYLAGASGLALIAMQCYYLYTLVLVPDDADTEGQ